MAQILELEFSQDFTHDVILYKLLLALLWVQGQNFLCIRNKMNRIKDEVLSLNNKLKHVNWDKL